MRSAVALWVLAGFFGTVVIDAVFYFILQNFQVSQPLALTFIGLLTFVCAISFCLAFYFTFFHEPKGYSSKEFIKEPSPAPVGMGLKEASPRMFAQVQAAEQTLHCTKAKIYHLRVAVGSSESEQKSFCARKRFELSSEIAVAESLAAATTSLHKTNNRRRTKSLDSIQLPALSAGELSLSELKELFDAKQLHALHFVGQSNKRIAELESQMNKWVHLMDSEIIHAVVDVRRILSALEKRVESVKTKTDLEDAQSLNWAIELMDSKLIVAQDAVNTLLNSTEIPPLSSEQWEAKVEQLLSKTEEHIRHLVHKIQAQTF